MQLRHFYERHSWTPRTLDLQRALISPADSFATNIAQLNAFQPAVLRGYGSYLGALFRHAWQHQLTLFRPHAVVYGADRMADADRQLIETSYGVPVFSTYQAVEALRIAFQCERRAAFHLSLDQVAIRVVDAQGRTVGPGGSGELILSNLTNRATVLLNYQLGDVVSLSRDACPCGRSLPTLERIEGRADDLVVRPDGQVLHALMILGALRTVPELIQVQLVQEELQRFVLRAVVSPADAWPHLQPQVATCLRTLLGQHISLTLERVERIPPESSGKVRAVITHCQRPGSMP